MMKGEERERGMKGENGSYGGGTLLTRLSRVKNQLSVRAITRNYPTKNLALVHSFPLYNAFLCSGVQLQPSR